MNALKHTGGLNAVWEPSTFDLGRQPFHVPADGGFPDRIVKSVSVEMIHPEIDGNKITVARLDFGLPRVCSLSGPQSLEETLANVALVSAAPAMLRALFDVEKTLAYTTDQLVQLANTTSGRGEIAPETAALHLAVRAAIALATRKLEVKSAT